jgi:hypothetical protein
VVQVADRCGLSPSSLVEMKRNTLAALADCMELDELQARHSTQRSAQCCAMQQGKGYSVCGIKTVTHSSTDKTLLNRFYVAAGCGMPLSDGW